MKNNDDTILEILQGHKTAKWPTPKLVKIFISSTKTDFVQERKILLESIGPELQSAFDVHQLEIEFIDMHFGSEEKYIYDPFLFEDHLDEIRACHRSSRGCFFLGLFGNKYDQFIAPPRFEAELYELVLEKAKDLNLNANILESWYTKDKKEYILNNYRHLECQAWIEASIDIINIIHECSTQMDNDVKKKLLKYMKSTVEQQFEYALGIAPGTAHHMVCVKREWDPDKLPDALTFFQEKANYSSIVQEFCRTQTDEFSSRISSVIPDENKFLFSVPWNEGGINPDCEDHEKYLLKFRRNITRSLTNLITRSLEEQPELKSRKKIVEENFSENITHLTMCHDQSASDCLNSDMLYRIKQTVMNSNDIRHPPVIIYGNQLSGKTTLIKAIYKDFENWFPCRTLRIVRFVSTTPRSTYGLEILRTICQQICITLKLPEGFLPKDACFDQLYIYKWFQSLIRNLEELSLIFAIFIDDIHLINPLEFDSLPATLSWLPITLNSNVHIFCTTAVEINEMRLTIMQKEQLGQSEYYYKLTPRERVLEDVSNKFQELDDDFGKKAMSRIAALLTCSEYGLTEIEMLEILMPTSTNQDIKLEHAKFNFSTFCMVRRRLGNLIREKLMSGKLLIEWKHNAVKEIAKKRYLYCADTIRSTHQELANVFFDEFLINESDDATESSEETNVRHQLEIKETPFHSTAHEVVTYRPRHLEESWIHLLKAGDTAKLKSLCMCNFDFLLATLQTFSVSYLKCMLEYVRCYLLDREIELVYYSIKKSTDVLTRDTYQLGTQLISWLRPVAECNCEIMSTLVTSAMAWCDGFTLPLAVPLNDWLQPPLPQQSKIMNIANVKLVSCTPNGQHVVVVVDNDAQLWHIMTNQMVHAFKGHTDKINCIDITMHSQYLITGSDDASTIIWDLKSLTIKLCVRLHVAPVLCVSTASNNSVIISGGGDSNIIVSSLTTGKAITKIDHHRGPVTTIKVTFPGDIMVSGSSDGRVCVWSLKNFTLLNTIILNSPVRMLDVSPDSVFLIVCCNDNIIHIKTLATGTQVHSLADHKSSVRSICIAHDNNRLVSGRSDGKVYIYDIHSAKVIKVYSGQNGEVTCLKITENDNFLLTTGGNRILFYPFRRDDNVKSFLKMNKKSHLKEHCGVINCLEISRDGQMSATGGSDYLVNVWQLTNQELLLTLVGHVGSITAVSFAPNSMFLASGSDDKTVKIWGLPLGREVFTFAKHQVAVCAVLVFMDSNRVMSSDLSGNIHIWTADDGNLLHSYNGPSKRVLVTTNMKYIVSTSGNSCLKIWSLLVDDEKYSVGHTEEITCFVLTHDSQHIITGSKDMSLKVWQTVGGKLSQVFIGHTDVVTCVAVAISDKSHVVSGSCDNSLIVWDINTGADLHTLSAHLNKVTCVKLSGDGSIILSGSEDKSIIIWDTRRGLQLTSLQLHFPIITVEVVSDFSRISVLLKDTKCSPIICLHNTPAKYIKLPSYCAPDKEILENPKPAPTRPMKRLLKKEVSLDTYTWQKKYAHLTSNLVIPSIDERFKRRFSVSASMEEISKIPECEQNKGMGNKQASLAQSQHFDQLEALWNRSPPNRRKLNQVLSKQSSLAESQTYGSDDRIDAQPS